MKRTASGVNCVLAFLIAGMLAAGQAIADKPSGAGGGKGEKSEHRDKGKSDDRKSRQRDDDDHDRSRRDSAESS